MNFCINHLFSAYNQNMPTELQVYVNMPTLDKAMFCFLFLPYHSKQISKFCILFLEREGIQGWRRHVKQGRLQIVQLTVLRLKMHKLSLVSSRPLDHGLTANQCSAQWEYIKSLQQSDNNSVWLFIVSCQGVGCCMLGSSQSAYPQSFS